MGPATAAIAVVLLYAAVHSAPAVFVPLALAFFSAVLVDPLVGRLQRIGLPRGLCCFAAVLVLLVGASCAVYVCYQPFAQLYGKFPRYEDKLREAAEELQRRTLKLHRTTETFVPTAEPRVPKVQVVESPRELTVRVLAGLGSLAETAAVALFVPFLTLFLLLDKARLISAVERLLGAGVNVPDLEKETGHMARAYFLGNLVVGAGVGCAHWLTLRSLGFENAFALGLLTGYVNIVPIVGLPVAAALIGAQSLSQFDSRVPLAAALSVAFATHVLVGNWVVPRYVGSRVRVNGFAATTAMLLLGWSWGVAGFLLAVPLAAQAKILLAARGSPWAALLED